LCLLSDVRRKRTFNFRPSSILLLRVVPAHYDSTKLEEDSERIRQYYQAQGYFTARADQPLGKVYDVYAGIKIPLIHPNSRQASDVTMVINEGNKYSLRNFSFVA